MEERSSTYDQDVEDQKQEELKQERIERRERLGQHAPADEQPDTNDEERTEV